MSRLNKRRETDLQADTLDALAPARLNGKLADVYLEFANSEEALRAYLYMEQGIRSGSLNDREIEAVKLRVSQHTGCEYCLSIHTFKCTKAGLDKAAQQAVRRGDDIGEARMDCLLQITNTLLSQPGKLDDALLAHARSNGITDQNLVDLTLLMSTIFFTNITNHINDSQSPLAPAPPLSTDRR